MNPDFWTAPRRMDLLRSATSIAYTTEHEMRDALGTMAFIHGWDVATEILIDNNARIDLGLFCPDAISIFIELKKPLKTARELRVALSQADAYRRMVDLEGFGGKTWSVLGADHDPDRVDPAGRTAAAFPDVALETIPEVMAVIGWAYAIQRREISRQRAVLHRQRAALMFDACLDTEMKARRFEANKRSAGSVDGVGAA